MKTHAPKTPKKGHPVSSFYVKKRARFLQKSLSPPGGPPPRKKDVKMGEKGGSPFFDEVSNYTVSRRRIGADTSQE